MIETFRLKILPFTKDHITDEYISWLNDPILMKYSEQRHHTHNRESCLAYFNNFNFKQNVFAAILVKDTNQHIGNINYYIDKFNQTADMGILIGNHDVQGQGLGAEAWLSLMFYLFSIKDVRKVTAGTMSCNLRMLKIMKKSFMSLDSISSRYFLADGSEFDLVRYSIFKEDFLEAKKQNPSEFLNMSFINQPELNE